MRALSFFAVALACAVPAAAQTPLFEVRPTVGAYLPTGAQRDLFRTSAMYGIQYALELRPTFHFVGSFIYMPAHSKFQVSDARVNLFQYDVGAEFNARAALVGAWELRPFVGVGAGGRTYDYATSDFATRSCAAAYGAAGTEFQYGLTALRVEGRHYLSCFKDPVRNDTRARNDFELSLGIAYHVSTRRL
jgi:hypothetical protein